LCEQNVQNISEETVELCEILSEIVKHLSLPSNELLKVLNLNGKDKSERTPLHLSTILRLPQITKILLENVETDLSQQDKKCAKNAGGKTPLHYASENGTTSCWKFFLSKIRGEKLNKTL